jgi:hypothetical protein
MTVDTADVVDAIEGNDPDRLLRLIDGLCSARDWDGLVDLAARCRSAVDRGKQLWGVAYHADYRLALEAPGPWAAPVAVRGGGGFTLGPLTEVAACRHRWHELEPHLPPGTARSLVAHERVIHGEVLDGVADIDPHLLELPLHLEPWEPRYPSAAYRFDRADFPSPDPVTMEATDLPPPGPVLDHQEELDALFALTRAWVEESNGRSEAVVVEGSAASAISALGPRHGRIGRLSPPEALAWMGWAAASGGAHGKRPGAAAGRFTAWWALAALGDLLDVWPVPADRLGEAASSLRWYAWDDLAPSTGWVLRLAVEDLDHHVGWAVSAIDAV